ncbi:GIY-YIG nuclease family protein [Patescibacteria group bacterium]
MTYVYYLKLKNGQIYKGVTEDLQRRMYEHESGKVKSTKYRLPVTLIGYEAYLFKSDAQRRERFLKTTNGRRIMNQQYRDVINN